MLYDVWTSSILARDSKFLGTRAFMIRHAATGPTLLDGQRWEQTTVLCLQSKLRKVKEGLPYLDIHSF
jgi:hypothetical protein